MSDSREPISIPAGAAIHISGNDGYAQFRHNGEIVRVRVTGSRRDGELIVFNTDELVDQPEMLDPPTPVP